MIKGVRLKVPCWLGPFRQSSADKAIATNNKRAQKYRLRRPAAARMGEHAFKAWALSFPSPRNNTAKRVWQIFWTEEQSTEVVHRCAGTFGGFAMEEEKDVVSRKGSGSFYW